MTKKEIKSKLDKQWAKFEKTILPLQEEYTKLAEDFIEVRYSNLTVNNRKVFWDEQVWTVNEYLVIDSFLAKFHTYDLQLVYFFDASDAIQYLIDNQLKYTESDLQKRLSEQKHGFENSIFKLRNSIKRYKEGFGDKLTYGDYKNDLEKNDILVSFTTASDILKLFFN